jgi:hypothetical protein
MQSKTKKMLPKTAAEIRNGGIYNQPRKCGKSNCKCANGYLHSAYYFFTRVNGKLIKIYIRKSEMKNISRLVIEATAQRTRLRYAKRNSVQLLRSLRQSLHEKQGLINSLRGI